MSYRVEKRKEDRPIRIRRLRTDQARNWEEFNWLGDHLAVIRNDTPDLHIMFDRKGERMDQIPIPRITYGSRQITIEYGSEKPGEPRLKFEKIFVQHNTHTDGEIWFRGQGSGVSGQGSAFSVQR